MVLGYPAMPERDLVAQSLQRRLNGFFDGRLGEVRMVGSPGDEVAKIYQTLRETLINGQLTLSITVGALVISMVFIAFYFASQQNKRNYEELYTLLSRVNDRLKKLEEKQDR